MLDTKPLRGKGRVYSFPDSALFPIPAAQAFVRAGRGILPVQVSEPPHVIVNATRRYAVYSDRFIAVPPRQIGIAGPRASADLLKAVALYLSSDFTVYQQFLASPQWGIHVSVATLDVLKTIPFPYERLISAGLREWADLHAALVEASSVQPKHPANQEAELFENESERSKLSLLEAELNDRVAAVLGLRERERWLVADLVHVKMKLLQGKVDAFATHAPTSTEFADYAGVLKHELDAFIAVATDERHAVDIVRDNHGSMIRISRGAPLSPTNSVRVHRADSSTARPLMAIRERLLKKHSQWLYFERALRVYKPDATYLFKPMQYFHWLKSQALVDAAEIIADRAATGEK
jgi:hypothetical protein